MHSTTQDDKKCLQSFLDEEAYNKALAACGTNYAMINNLVMDNTIGICETDELLKSAIEQSISHQYVVYHQDKIDVDKDEPTKNITISKKRTLEAASAYKGKKVAILNFANNHSIGGSPWYAGAQEESICRCSTLYPCLKAKNTDFYQLHINMFREGKLDSWGNDDLIYTPNVEIIKTDESSPRILKREDRYSVDVITCAAPQLGEYYDQDKFESVIKSRIEKILQVAKKEKVEVLILGAFGCGAFRNPPQIVAKAFKTLLEQYYIETVEFAIYCRPNRSADNYMTFEEVLKI